MECALILAADCVVGESLQWDDRRGRLVWVDIIGRRIHTLDPETGEHRQWPTPGRVTSIGLRADGGAIVGLERTIALWDWGDDFRIVCEVEPDLPDNRLNEGVVGPDGAFWVGTMQNNIAEDDTPRDISGQNGRIYRYTADGRLAPVTEHRFGLTNTFVWPGADRFVTADTSLNQLYLYRWDPATGLSSDRKILLDGFPRGLPDGSCLDAEGMIWNARVAGGGCLARITPEGDLLQVAELDCSWPTSCAFGGADLATLYVTSARFTMTQAHLDARPQEGGLFAIRPGVRGLPAHRFGAPESTRSTTDTRHADPQTPSRAT